MKTQREIVLLIEQKKIEKLQVGERYWSEEYDTKKDPECLWNKRNILTIEISTLESILQ
jgi:hypothetical protein